MPWPDLRRLAGAAKRAGRQPRSACLRQRDVVDHEAEADVAVYNPVERFVHLTYRDDLDLGGDVVLDFCAEHHLGLRDAADVRPRDRDALYFMTCTGPQHRNATAKPGGTSGLKPETDGDTTTES